VGVGVDVEVGVAGVQAAVVGLGVGGVVGVQAAVVRDVVVRVDLVDEAVRLTAANSPSFGRVMLLITAPSAASSAAAASRAAAISGSAGMSVSWKCRTKPMRSPFSPSPRSRV
jgi:hypothetical protein